MKPDLLCRQLLRYGFAGLLNTLVGLAGILACRRWLEMSEYAANACGYMLGIVAGFALNRAFTFRHSGPAAIAAVKYFALFLVCYSINLIVLWICLEIAETPALFAQIFSILVYSCAFFLACRIFVFKNQREAAFDELS